MPPQPNAGPGGGKTKRAVRRKPQPPSTEALKGRAFGSRPARPLPKPKAAPKASRPPRPVANLIPGLGQARQQHHAIAHVPKPKQAAVVRKVRQRQAKTNLPQPVVQTGHLVQDDPGKTYSYPKVMTQKERSADVAAKLAPGKGSDPVTIAKNAAKDVVDLYANAIPSTYHLAETAVTGHPVKAAKMLAGPYVQAFKHPGKSFTEHPVGTLLLAAGAKGALGHAGGRALRVAPSKTLRALGSTERAPKVLPGARVTEPQQYSRNVIKKAEQKTVESVKAQRAVRKGQPPPSQMTPKAIKRRVDEEVQAAKIVGQQHAGQAQHAAVKAIGKKPTAATTLAAQGITNASHTDLHAYLGELEAQAPHLVGPELKLNTQARTHLREALKHHNEARVQQAAAAYSTHRAPQEQQAIDLGLVKPAAAEETRLAPVAVRRFGASAEAQKVAKASTKQARVTAERGAKQAGKDVVKAEQTLQRARANARVSVATRKKSPQLAVAEKARNQAVVQVTRLKAKGVGGPALRQARLEAKTANRTVGVERARIRGVAPAPADALRRALQGKDEARTAASGARAVRQQAVAANRAVKKASFVSQAGEPISVQQLRDAHTGPEPAFVSHSPVKGRQAALPVDRPSIPVKEQRTGEAVRKGTLVLHPNALVDQSVRTQGLIDSATARNRFIEDFGYRPDPKGAVQAMKTQKAAENTARTAKEQTGVDWSPMQHGDGQWHLVPKDAKSRLAEHQNTPAQHPVLKAMGAQWRRNVLAFSPRWLTGNVLEGAFRSVVAGAGPRSYVTATRTLRALKRQDPAAAEQLKARALSGGQYKVAERLATERQAGEDLGRLVRFAHAFRQAPGPKQVADVYGAYTKLVFNSLNGRLEGQFQTAMLGKALRDSPLMSRQIVKIGSKAAEDAAKGLKNTDAQVALGREVDRMYGQYGKFSPGFKQAVALYTPFAAWTVNAAKFLTVVLPKDHPVLTSLLASAQQASEEWRKQHGIVADPFGEAQGMAPGWLQGSIPGKDASHLRVSRYTPFGIVANEGNNPVGGIPGLLLPQFEEILQNTTGKDWTGRKSLQKNESGWRDLTAATAAFLEGQVPAASQVAHVAGVRTPNMADTTKILPGVANRARAQFDPFMYTKSKTATKGSTATQAPGTIVLPKSGSIGSGKIVLPPG